VTWVSWRLQRTETAIAACILALIAALLVPTGLHIAQAYRHDGLSSCLAFNPSAACSLKIQAFQSHFQTLFDLTNWFTLAPGLIGVALAAPFILDLEHGTYRLAWTQSITRGRWITGKLGLAIVCALLAAGALIAVTTWWRGPYVQLNGRLDTGTYDAEGIVVLGYTLFALGLALALGVVWRRAAAALTVAFVGYFVARIFVDTWLRNRLVAPLKATWKGVDHQPPSLYHANVITEQAVGRFPGGLSAHGNIGVRPGNAASVVFHSTYQPASHFWSLQLAETGLFAGVAVALILFAAWWTHERTA
jgi:phosphotransferase system  glucose/maltose/N-acetylglucosamine-specific IIC component